MTGALYALAAVLLILGAAAFCRWLERREGRGKTSAAPDTEAAYRDARAVLAPPGTEGYERLDMRPRQRRAEIAELKAMLASSERSDR